MVMDIKYQTLDELKAREHPLLQNITVEKDQFCLIM